MFKLIRSTLIALAIFALALPAVAAGPGTNVNGVKAAPSPVESPAGLR